MMDRRVSFLSGRLLMWFWLAVSFNKEEILSVQALRESDPLHVSQTLMLGVSSLVQKIMQENKGTNLKTGWSEVTVGTVRN